MAKFNRDDFIYAIDDSYNHTGRCSVCKVIDNRVGSNGEIQVGIVATIDSKAGYMLQSYGVDPDLYRLAKPSDWVNKPNLARGVTAPLVHFEDGKRVYLKKSCHKDYEYIRGVDFFKFVTIRSKAGEGLYRVIWSGDDTNKEHIVRHSELQVSKPRGAPVSKGYSVGSLLIAKHSAPYSDTANHAVCRVTKPDKPSGLIEVVIIATALRKFKSSLGVTYTVCPKQFTLATPSDIEGRKDHVWVDPEEAKTLLRPLDLVVADKDKPNTLWEIQTIPEKGDARFRIVGVTYDHLADSLGEVRTRNLSGYRLSTTEDIESMKHLHVDEEPEDFPIGSFIIREAATAVYIWEVIRPGRIKLVGGLYLPDKPGEPTFTDIGDAKYRLVSDVDFMKLDFCDSHVRDHFMKKAKGFPNGTYVIHTDASSFFIRRVTSSTETVIAGSFHEGNSGCIGEKSGSDHKDYRVAVLSDFEKVKEFDKDLNKYLIDLGLHLTPETSFRVGDFLVEMSQGHLWEVHTKKGVRCCGGSDESAPLGSVGSIRGSVFTHAKQRDYEKITVHDESLGAYLESIGIRTQKQTNPIKLNKKVIPMKTSKTSTMAQKMINRMFKKVDGVKLDVMSGSIGLERDGSIFTLVEVEQPELKEGETKGKTEYVLSENFFAEMAFDMPAFAQATQIKDVKPKDLVLDTAGNVFGWATSTTDKSIRVIKPNGMTSTYSPSKVEMMGQGQTVMVISSAMTSNMNSMLPMLMMLDEKDSDSGAKSGGMKDMMLPLMMMNLGGQGNVTEGGMNPMMMMMMLGKEDGGMEEMLPMMMVMGGGMGGQQQGDQQQGGMMGGMNPMMMMMMLKK